MIGNRLVLLVVLVLLGCSDSSVAPGSCLTGSDCPAGQICAEATCLQLCQVQSQCPAERFCAADGVCRVPSAGSLPVIQGVVGNNPADVGRVVDGVVVSGLALGQAVFELRRPGVEAVALSIRAQTDSLVELGLPVDVRSGEYLLAATNQSGSATQAVTLLLPELDGAEILTRLNAAPAGTLILDRLPVGTTSNTVARGDHTHDSLTAAALASQAFGNAVLGVGGSGGGFVADTVDGFDSAELMAHRAHVANGVVAAGADLEINIGKDATGVSTLVWRLDNGLWQGFEPALTAPLLNDPALHAYYAFEETVGAAVQDVSGNAHTLGLAGAYRLAVPGRRGLALGLGGTATNAGGVASTNAFSMIMGNELTMSAWIFPHFVNTDIHWLTLNEDNAGHAVYFSFLPANCNLDRLSLRGENSGNQCGASPIRVGEWTHVAATYNQATGTVDVYFNGKLDSRTTSAPLTFSGATMANFWIGQRFSGTGWDFIGRIDEVAIFGRVLTAAEIERLYTHGMRHGGYEIEKNADGTVRLLNSNLEAQTLRLMVVE